VDFSYMLYADQVGCPFRQQRTPGVKWVRTTTDIPAAMTAILRGDTDWKDYLRSIIDCDVEAVFSPRDPLRSG